MAAHSGPTSQTGCHPAMTLHPFPLTGELAALTAALFWAVASISFAEIGRHIRAIHLNLIKGGFAILLMVGVLCSGTLLQLPTLSLTTITTISPYGWTLLILSGVVGIALGDTAYFACLKRIGPQKGLMLESTAPVLAALFALLLYDEYLPVRSWAGIGITTLGVIIVVRLSTGAAYYRSSFSGILFGLAASAGQAAGIVLSRMALDGENIEPLAGGLVRLSSGLIALLLWLLAMRITKTSPGTGFSLLAAALMLKKKNLLRKLFTAMFIGTFLAIWLQQLAVKFTSAGIAQALLATCPLIGTLIAVRQGHRQPTAVWLGLLLGLTGICLLFTPLLS